MQRIAPKLRRIILLDFGLVTFRFHFGKIRKPVIFMIFGPGGRVHDSQNQLLKSLETPTIQETNDSVRNLFFGNLKMSKI